MRNNINNVPVVQIYTDGSYRDNPHRGGWASLLSCGPHNVVIYDCDTEEGTTINRMELLAVINALSMLTQRCDVFITCDSRYVVNGITQWIYNWKRNDWKNTVGDPVKNKDLWLELEELTHKHICTFKWIRSHQKGNTIELIGNRCVDYFASTTRLDNIQLY